MLSSPCLALGCSLARFRWAERCRAPAWIELCYNKGSLSSGRLDPPGNGGVSLWVCMLGDVETTGVHPVWKCLVGSSLVWLWAARVAKAVRRWRGPGRFCSCSPLVFFCERHHVGPGGFAGITLRNSWVSLCFLNRPPLPPSSCRLRGSALLFNSWRVPR